MFKKLKAFTLTETITVLSIIAFIAIITVGNTIKSGVVSEKKMKTLSKTFYLETEYAYQLILTQEARRFSVINLNGLGSIFNKDTDTKVLRNHFYNYMDLSDESCSKFPRTDDTAPYLDSEGIKCAVSSRNINIMFYLDRGCNNTYQLKEYLQDDNNLRAVVDACGFVAYAPTRSKGIMGKDFFAIPLDKRRLK